MIHRILQARASELLPRIAPFIVGTKVLDAGCGSCHLTHLLAQNHYEAVGLDIKGQSYFKEINPDIYDGSRFPYDADVFDTALLVCMLHHTADPEQIIKEAARVATQIIIIEDVVRGWLHRYVTCVWDSVLNLEFSGHPHQNKTDIGWRELFAKLGLRLVASKAQWSFLFMWQVTYVLERE